MKPKPAPSEPIEVLLADSSQIQVQLLTSAMRRHPEFKMASCPLDVDIILSTLRDSPVDVLLLAGNTQGGAGRDMTLLRRLHISYPRVPKVLLLESFDRDLVVNAFRSGARGLFFTEAPFRSLCKCIQVVHRGQIWASAEQIDYLVDLVSQVPSLRVVNVQGSTLLTRARSRSSPWSPKACRTAISPANSRSASTRSRNIYSGSSISWASPLGSNWSSTLLTTVTTAPRSGFPQRPRGKAFDSAPSSRRPHAVPL